jgi:hypothetical protein
MSKWLKKFLEQNPQKSTDNTDRFRLDANMSVLSVPHQGISNQNFDNISKKRTDITDNTDRFRLDTNMSVLSVPTQGGSNQNSVNTSFYFSEGPELLGEYEERIAIAEYDGLQSSTRAQHIAYQDAFIAVLNTLPYGEAEGDWLAQRITIAKEWLLAQGITQPK